MEVKTEKQNQLIQFEKSFCYAKKLHNDALSFAISFETLII